MTARERVNLHDLKKKKDRGIRKGEEDCDSGINFEWLMQITEDELITQSDDSWSFQQDHGLSNTQRGIDTYYFSSFCGCSAWTATSSKGCRHFKEHQSMSHNSAFKEASTSYYTTVSQHWKCMNVIRRQMSKPTHISFLKCEALSAWKEERRDWILLITQ